MSVHSRNKGAVAEREIASILRAAGWPDARRTGQMQSQRGAPEADVFAIPGARLEVRRRERIEIVRWCREHEALTPPLDIPIVVFRPSREPWRACLELDELLPLLKLKEAM